MENEEEDKIRNNPDVELKKCKIFSQFYEKNDEDETAKEIDLPTPESLEKLCSPPMIKDLVTFDLQKFKSFFEEQKEENTNDVISVLNLDKISSIKNGDILPFVIIFIGGINSTTDIYTYFDETVKNPSEECYVDNSFSYLEYLNSFIDYLKNSENISIAINQMELLFNALDELGVNIHRNNKNVLYRNIKDSFFSMEKNKILVILAPSNNFWIKSPKSTINEQNYDIKLNNYNNIFYHKKFIKKFLEKVTKHPRCVFGLICSMSFKNLKNCWDGLEKQFSDICPKKVIFFDQKDHEVIMIDPNKKKPQFFRKMQKILEHLKKDKEQNNKNKDKDQEGGDNVEYFNEKNIIILESEEDKMEDTKNNSVYVNLFSEEYLEKDKQGQEAEDINGDRAINYIKKLLENCCDDIRDYISKHKIKDEEYSKD